MFQNAIVIGCPGAGKSTFSRKLRDITGIPLYHLDMLWHRPDRTTISEPEFDRKLNGILLKESWIIDGNYSRTLEPRLRACDMVFLLDFPLDTCLLGASSRIGRKREDLPWLETEFDDAFRQFILDFPQKRLPRLYKLIETYCKDKRILIFKSREESEAYLKTLSLSVPSLEP